jgi:hypothetical protein
LKLDFPARAAETGLWRIKRKSAQTPDPTGSTSDSGIRPSIGTEKPIPEEIDHREIAVRMPVMNEVKFLLASEPCKPLKSRSLYVVLLVEKDVRVEGHRTCNYLNHEEIKWQYEICTGSQAKSAINATLAKIRSGRALRVQRTHNRRRHLAAR